MLVEHNPGIAVEVTALLHFLDADNISPSITTLLCTVFEVSVLICNHQREWASFSKLCPEDRTRYLPTLQCNN